MRECQVESCENPASEVYREGGVEYAVCSSHDLELRSGEHHYADGESIILGAASLPTFIGMTEKVGRGSEHMIVTIVLGRNGVPDDTIAFQLPDGLRDAFRRI